MYYSLNANLTTPYEMRHYLSNEDKLVDVRRFPPHLHDEMEFYVILEGDIPQQYLGNISRKICKNRQKTAFYRRFIYFLLFFGVFVGVEIYFVNFDRCYV